MEIELPRDFKELFESLNVNRVRYLLIGGYAVGVYGYSRTTNDIDIFVSDDGENIQRIIAALNDFGGSDTDLSSIFSEKRSLVEIGVEPVKVQLMNFADGIVFDEAFERKMVIKVDDIEISTIGKEDLIANKLASGRHKDLDDVEMIERLSEQR
jgi:predicted nucleotidyltransferase